MDIYYVNHKNRKIDFMNGNYSVEESSFFSHSWDYETQELSGYGERVTRLKKKLQERKIIVHINSLGLVSCEQAYNDMLNVMEADNFSEIPGTLYIDDSYINCFFIVNKPRYFVPGIGSISCELKMIAPYPLWIMEQTISINPISNDTLSNEVDGVKQYPYSYPYTYPLLKTETNVNIDHYTDSDFRLKIYGPATSVYITIAGHPYIVQYPLENGEYMTIDSRSHIDKEKRLYVTRADGTTVNIFDYRDVENSVFKKIPAGRIKIDYARTYGIDLTVFKERSEPLWK